MDREPVPHELDLTETGALASAMSAAVGRLRKLAVSAFNAGPEEPAEDGAALSGGQAAP